MQPQNGDDAPMADAPDVVGKCAARGKGGAYPSSDADWPPLSHELPLVHRRRADQTDLHIGRCVAALKDALRGLSADMPNESTPAYTQNCVSMALHVMQRGPNLAHRVWLWVSPSAHGRDGRPCDGGQHFRYRPPAPVAEGIGSPRSRVVRPVEPGTLLVVESTSRSCPARPLAECGREEILGVRRRERRDYRRRAIPIARRRCRARRSQRYLSACEPRAHALACHPSLPYVTLTERALDGD